MTLEYILPKIERQIQSQLPGKENVKVLTVYQIPGVPNGAWDMDVQDRYLVMTQIGEDTRYFSQGKGHESYYQIDDAHATYLITEYQPQPLYQQE